MIIDLSDFPGLKYHEVDKIGRDLYYKVLHQYDKNIPQTTVKEVNDKFITDTFSELGESIVNNKTIDTKNLTSLVEKVLSNEINIVDIINSML